MTERAKGSAGTAALPRVLLTLVAPAALEEALADLLLEAPELADGFTSSAASGHGAGLRFEAASERVRGRGRRVRFEIAIEHRGADALLERLQAALRDANLYYWICPMLECGILGGRAGKGARP
ncbi:MAG: DUF3240 domain-containing protein [Burkholderiales bacterium]|jgi:hypothetical protein|nr:MAG: DUF3240 domain-containing protein [Burkholderiales bacterium]